MTTDTRTKRSDSTTEPDWNVAAIVAELRTLRDASLLARQRVGKPAKLPSRKVLAGIVEGLSAALFPNRLGTRELALESVDYFVGRTLDVTLRDLVAQVVLELHFASGEERVNSEQEQCARVIVYRFAESLPSIRALLETDILSAHMSNPAARNIDEVLVCYPGLTAMVHHRLAHSLHGLGVPLIARVIAAISHSLTGIDIHPGAKIGERFSIDHGTGIVIGETAVIGDGVRLFHGVTLGEMRFTAAARGERFQYETRHPTVEDDVVIYSGATILGPVTIGRRSVIGGNVWLTQNVPAGSHIAQAKARNEDFDGGSGI